MTSPDPLLRLLRPFALHPDRSALVLDFDGVLAPIVVDPDAARPLPEAVAAVERLVGRIGVVAVTSGRPLEFLQAVLPDHPDLVLVGQHGLERAVGGRRMVDPSAEEFREAVAAATAEAESSDPELVVEWKGGIAVNLHWRTLPHRAAEWEALGRRLAQRHGLAAHPMRMGMELRAPVSVDKGTAVAELAAGRHAALFAGDDHGDLAGFAALDQLVASGRLDHAVRVAVRSDEAPPALLEAADYQVDGPAGVAALLRRIADSVAA
ncbi:MAG TPA: trehalose-phosphatase [Acidimicrobiia bacterium]|nr:trehalose-phosphatase [Acidimicrobiia bacterium]